MSDSRCSYSFLDDTQYDERGRPIRKTRATAPRYDAAPARGDRRRAARRMTAEEQRQKIAEEKEKFRHYFPNRGVGMLTGTGKMIGRDLPVMDFVSTLEFFEEDFPFVEFVDHIDPENCDKPVEQRHYLLKWEGQPVQELSWTHCGNIKDHRSSGLQEYYDDVTLTRLDQCLTEYQQKIAKKNATIARLRKERDEARAELQLARGEEPIGDVMPDGVLAANGDLDDPAVEVELPATPLPRDDVVNSATERTFASLGYGSSMRALGESAQLGGDLDESVVFGSPAGYSTPIARRDVTSAGVKRGLSPGWVADAGYRKKPRTEPAFANAFFPSDPRQLHSSLSQWNNVMNGTRSSTSMSTTSRRGGPPSLPHWIDATGWSRFKVNALGSIYKRLRHAHRDMPDAHFRELFMEKVRNFVLPAPKKS